MKTLCARAVGALTAILLGSVLTTQAVPVTFQVNMSVQEALGNFNAANLDYVEARGSFLVDAGNNWLGGFVLTNDPAGDPSIYVGVYDVTNAVSSTVQYQFVINGNTWEDAVGNRSFTVAAGGQTLPVVYFNDLTSVPTGVDVTFQVNMGVQLALGNFHPDVDTVVAAGGYNGWSQTGFVLTSTPMDTNIYSGVYHITSISPGTSVPYKFLMNGPTHNPAGDWESNPNRTFTLSNDTQVLPLAYFNRVTNVPTPVTVTFNVNMGVQEALGNFDPALGGFVVAAGSFNGWATDFVLTNDPPSTVFRGDYTVTSGGTVNYQYVINGSTWETAVGDRGFTVPGDTNQFTLPAVFWNNVNSIGGLNMEVVGNQLSFTWTAAINVRLQSAGDINGPWTDVANTLGQGSAMVDLGPGRMFFRLKGP